MITLRVPSVRQRGTVTKSDVTTIIEPTEISSVVVNPGKGWVLYNNVSDHSSSALALSSVGYTRFYWAQIQPINESTYDWSVIDNYIAAWAAVGKKAAFGIMNCAINFDLQYITPEWVFVAGAAHTTATTTGSNPTTAWIPVWDDAVFLAKVTAFITALATRYDGHANVAFIDIRSYGNYGEGHVYEISPSVAISSSKVREHITIHTAQFNTTPLYLATGDGDKTSDYIWATTQGVGLRNDAIMGIVDLSYLAALDGPKQFEFWTSYHTMKNHGTYPFSATTLRSNVETAYTTYCSFGQFFWSEELGSDADLLLADEPTLVAEMANRMGYHFVLTKAVLPEVIPISSPFAIELSWLNKGVARIFEPCHVALGLMNESDEIVSVAFTSAVPANWASDVTTVESLTVTFETMSSVGTGDYRLVVGLFKEITDNQPTYKLGISGIIGSGWYPIKTMSVNCVIL